MKSQKKKKTTTKVKKLIYSHAVPLTESELKSLMEDFYQAAKADNLPNAEDALKIEDEH